MKRRILILFGVLVVLTLLVTAAAKISAPTGSRVDLSFLGALIGAAGTIYAAVIAYAAVDWQISHDRRATLTVQLKAEQERLKTLGEIRKKAEMLVSQLAATAPGSAPNARRLYDMWTAKQFPTVPVGFSAHDIVGALWEAISRLKMIAEDIEIKVSQLSADMHGAVMQNMETHAVTAISDFAAIVRLVPDIVEKQKTLSAALENQLDKS